MDTGKKISRVTLRTIADRVGLTPGTISAVLNDTRAAERIPQHTRDRVIAAARELNYSPNPLARALRAGKSTIQRLDTSDISHARGALVIMDSDQFERALNAIRQAGLRVPDDVSVVDLFDVPAAWNHPSFASAPEYPGYEAVKAS
jgi:DNA-binding LacI/PurR family transcriptional regulator